MPTEYIVPIQRTDGAFDYTSMRVLTARLADLEQMDSARAEPCGVSSTTSIGLSAGGLCPLVA
jgi:hypothetical protein